MTFTVTVKVNCPGWIGTAAASAATAATATLAIKDGILVVDETDGLDLTEGKTSRIRQFLRLCFGILHRIDTGLLESFVLVRLHRTGRC